MSAPTQFELMVLITTLIVLAAVYSLVKYLWKWPLRNGQSFFLGAEVPAAFYEGPGKTWLKGYRTMLVALHLVLAAFFGACFAFGRWDLIPLCGFWALLYTAAMQAFQAWTRHKLGTNPPVRPVAIALESRRLSDYISWPMETLMVVVVAFSWWLLLRSGTLIDWRSPLILTWVVLGFLPGKIAIVRFSYPLPAERTEEHYQYQDAERRNWLRVWGAFGWFFVVILFGGALRHAWSPSKPVPALQWFVISVAFVVWGYSMIVRFRGMGQLRAMGSNLLPHGSWRTPFRRSSCTGLSRPYMIWFAVWFCGILVLILYSQFR
jgi:hypothetical protein